MRTLILSLLLTCPLAAVAANAAHDPIHFSGSDFAEQRQTIEKALSSADKYRELGADQRRDVLTALDDMGDLFSRYGTVEQMTDEAKIKLFNRQEQVNTLLTAAAEDSRMVCSRETPVGSHRPINVCKTVAERRREREGSTRMLQDHTGRKVLPRGN